MISNARRLAIALAGLCAFIDLYATQPLLPLFAREFAASAEQVSLTVSATTFAVALVAPFVGAVADVLGRRAIIVSAMALLTLPTILIAASGSLGELVLWRFAQGILLPPIFAVVVAYIGDEWPIDEVPGATATYVAASGFGGFLGRFLTGLVADHGGWRLAFVMLAGITAGCALVVGICLPRERHFKRAAGYHASLRLMFRHFLDPSTVATFAIGFAVLFSFVATFTYVSFHLAAPPFELSASALGSLFAIYLLAVVVTPMSVKWSGRVGRRTLVMAAVAAWGAGLLLTLIPWLPMIIAGLAIASASGFACQATATGFLAARTTTARASAVGLYVTCYYLGGSAGAVVPGIAWMTAGWPGCVGLVIATLILMALLVARFWHRERPSAN